MKFSLATLAAILLVSNTASALWFGSGNTAVNKRAVAAKAEEAEHTHVGIHKHEHEHEHPTHANGGKAKRDEDDDDDEVCIFLETFFF